MGVCQRRCPAVTAMALPWGQVPSASACALVTLLAGHWRCHSGWALVHSQMGAALPPGPF